MDRKGLGRRINIARKDKGMTGEQLADVCGINPVYLRQIESGAKIPSLPMFVTICMALGASPSYLLMDTVGCGNQDVDALADLCTKASPNQLRTIVAMIQTAVDTIQEQ